MLNYFEEGRKIDYFYTNDDELSNRSIIEFVKDVPNLTKYRINGVHGAVARTALPAMLNVMRQFLSPNRPSVLSVSQVRQYDEDSATRVQVRIKSATSQSADENWFLEGSLGRTKFRQLMSQGVPGFMKFLSEDQKLIHAVDRVSELHSVTVMSATGTIATGKLPAKLDTSRVIDLKIPVDKSPISFNAENTQTYNIIDNEKFEQFQYISRKISNNGDSLEIRLVDDFETNSLSCEGRDTGQIFAIKFDETSTLLNLFIVRAVIDSRFKKVIVTVPKHLASDSLNETLSLTEWDDIDINIV